MPDSLLPARQDFFQRVAVPVWVGRLAAGWSRSVVALALALLPALLLLLAALVGPSAFGDALRDPASVRDTFGRLIPAIATAVAIAISVALLGMRRDFASEAQEKAGDEFRARIREAAGLREAPLLIGELVGEVLAAAAAKARDAREAAHGRALDTLASGISLRAYLDLVEARAERTAGRMPRAWTRPDRLHLAILDFDQQMTVALARRFARDPHLSETARARMRELHELLTQYVALARMVRTLDFQWGLARMCHALLLAAIPALVVSIVMTLTFGAGAEAAWGAAGAAALVCAALAVALFPIAALVSHVARFVFVDQYSPPPEGVAIGPEAAALTRKPRVGRVRG